MSTLDKNKKESCPMAYQFVTKPLTVKEVDKLCNACETTKEKLIIWTLLDTGLTVSELCKLTSDNMLHQKKAIQVYGHLHDTSKNLRSRIVPMSKRIQPLLESCFLENSTFPLHIRQVQKIVQHVAKKAKLRRTVSPYILRHTFATRALKNGMPLIELQKLLGHKSLTATASYLNFVS